MRYVDTAVLVSALTNEARQSDVQAWFAAQASGALVISWWTLTEFSAATARKVRDKVLPADEMIRVRSAFTTGLLPLLRMLPLSRVDFDRAADFAGRPEVNLRSSDALHLAVAAAHGLELVTLDQRMASGGTTVGVATLLL